MPSTASTSSETFARRGDEVDDPYACPEPFALSLSGARIRLVDVGAVDVGAIHAFARQPSWGGPVHRQLRVLYALRPNWDGSGARPVAEHAIESAVAFLRGHLPASASEPFLSPLVRGGIQAEWHENGLDVEIEFPADGEPTFYVHDVRTGEEWSDRVASGGQALRNALRRFV